MSDPAREALDEAVTSGGVIMSIVTLVELWYVTKTTSGVSQEEVDAIREQVCSSPTMAFFPVDEAVAEKFTTIDRDLLRDPWDRFIVATALAFDLPLVTAARRIQNSGKAGAASRTWLDRADAVRRVTSPISRPRIRVLSGRPAAEYCRGRWQLEFLTYAAASSQARRKIAISWQVGGSGSSLRK